MKRALLVGLSTLFAVAGGCSSASDPGADPSSSAAAPPRWLGVDGERLGTLPGPGIARTTRFSTYDVCAQCHRAGDGPVLRDPKGRDVSPVTTWETSAMALAARDPFYLAVFAEELAFRGIIERDVQATCTRCHAPAASIELETAGSTPTFAMLTDARDTSAAAHLAREGNACTLCHQIAEAGLGTRASFTGGFAVEDQRRIYGPYMQPNAAPMVTVANFTPVYSAHIQRSALCATCHTVITNARDARGFVGPDFPEQVPFLEWLASAYANEGTPGPKAAACQDCHMSAVDDDGVSLTTAIARVAGDEPRTPFWRHGFEGANVALAAFGEADPAWFGVPLRREDHTRQRLANEKTLRRAATLDVSVTRSAEGAVASVTIVNESGHKLPTGYPSRRLIVHVRVTNPAGDVVYESGRTDPYGRLVARDGFVLEPTRFFPHFDTVANEEEVQIYESVPLDANNAPAHRPLDAVRYGKDNRLEPAGFDRFSSFAGFLRSVGVDADKDWGSRDVVKYALGNVPPGSTVLVELAFQVIRPADLEALAPTPASRRLFDFVTAAPPVPVVVASATATAP